MRLPHLLFPLFCLIATSALAAAPAQSSAPAQSPAPAPAAAAPAPAGKPPAAIPDPNASPDPHAAPSPNWIWGSAPATEGEVRYFRTTFDADIPAVAKTEDPNAAWIWAVCDDQMSLYLNGKMIARADGWSRASVIDIRSQLIPGKNVLAVQCRNGGGPAALAVKLEVRRQYGQPFRLVTDSHWKTWTQPHQGWRSAAFDDSAFDDAVVVARYGEGPWGEISATDPSEATAVERIGVPPGFKAELIYNVPRTTEGSWVSMTPDPKGRLYVSDQAGALFRVTPAHDNKPTQVERVDLDIGSAQGLLWAYDSLYVVVNGISPTHPSGLYRLRDTNGDDKLDQITTLKHFLNRTLDGPGYGEHGPHAVVLGPDKKLYVVAGNFTNLPDGILPSSPAKDWSEDQLLQRMTDGKGHDPTIYAPGSCITRTDPDGKNWEVFSVGMRNAYDMAFNSDGELFSFDSDMEWDMGAPWYRPTRICHVVSGAEFGWRNGSGKFPPYYLDSVPAILDMGAGSPTGVTFGTGAHFPAKYQRAFFACDWAYGRIFAIHLTPDGAGYKAEAELFLAGKPFDVTDVVINHDGAMSITIGGRGTQSGLYRVTYIGSESTAPAAPLEDPKATAARQLRHKLESFHGRRDPAAVAFAWPYLNSDDRFLRYAARIAVEAQDPATWTEQALSATDPRTLTSAIVALCRVGNRSLQPRILGSLARLDLAKLPHDQLLDALRAYELCFIRMGEPTAPATASSIQSRLEALFPSESSDVNHELCQLLVYLKSPTVIAKSLALLDKAPTQEEQLFYAFNLRNIRDGWTLAQRQAYFKWLNHAQQSYTGGASYKPFLQNVKIEAIATLGDDEKRALAPVLKPGMELAFSGPDAAVPARKFVRNWQMQDQMPQLDRLKSGRSYESGKAAFAAVSCIKCHRFNGDGGGSGPDISGVGSRFQPRDLLEAIVLPSKIISDQYQATEIITKSKRVVVGTIAEENDEKLVIRSSPLSTQTETVLKKDIAQRRPSKLSIMPEGLIDVLSENEVLDLLAYLRSAGDPRDPAFRPDTLTTPPDAGRSARSSASQ
jgi:putative heme-binding domain-containing protein